MCRGIGMAGCIIDRKGADIGMELRDLNLLKDGLQSVLGRMGKLCCYTRRQQFYRSNNVMREIFQELPDLVGMLCEHQEELNGDAPVFDLEGMALLLQELQRAQEARDYVMLADICELQMQPVFVALEERLVSALGVHIDEKLLKKNVRSCGEKSPQLLYSLLPEDVAKECLQGDGEVSDACMDWLVGAVEQCAGKGYVVEPTSSGYDTIAIRREGQSRYMHTNGNVISEAFSLAEEWLAQEKESYVFYGLGMGYAYREMLSMDDNISIQVLEANRELLLLAMMFAPLWELLDSGRFELVYDPTGHKLRKIPMGISEERGFYVFYPALPGIGRQELRERMETYFLEESSVRTQGRSLLGNFRKNCRSGAGNIRQLEPLFGGMEVIIVAAGPSLDKNMEQLRKKRDGVILLAAGTVLKKLLAAGIRPDYVIMLDANSTVYSQIQGVEDCGVPLLFLSTACSRVVENYQGERYLLCQKGFAPAEELAGKQGWTLVESGGSVMTAALDLCLRLKAGKIIFVGLDLAYTDSLDHAGGTYDHAKVVQDTGILVDSADGGKIATGKSLKVYLDWIERRIARRTGEEREIRILDATEGGARKKGMEIVTLARVMEGEA